MRNSIVHPSGKLMVQLGGNYHKQFHTGDLIIELKWVDEEPVMLIYKQVLGANSPAAMIEHADAYKYANSDGTASKALICELAEKTAAAIGADHDLHTAYRIIDAIMNYMPDLLMMPPAPKEIVLADAPTRGEDELTVKIDGKTIAEVLV